MPAIFDETDFTLRREGKLSTSSQAQDWEVKPLWLLSFDEPLGRIGVVGGQKVVGLFPRGEGAVAVELAATPDNGSAVEAALCSTDTREEQAA